MNRSCFVMVGLLLLCGIASAAEAQEHDFAGTKMCKVCHNKAETGDQFGKWEAGPHAKAFKSLAKPEAKEAAAKLGIDDPQKSPKCLKCHSTAYWHGETVKTTKIKVEEGVTCETCHGPGKDYMKKSIMEDRQKSIEAGLLLPDKSLCVKCHNEQSPTWKADRYTLADGTKVGFDFEQAAKKFAHPNPAKAK